MRRRLYVDLSIIARSDAGTGIQRVVRTIWQTLPLWNKGNFDIIPIAGTASGRYRIIDKDLFNSPIKALPLPIGRRKINPIPGDIFLGLDLATRVATRNSKQLTLWQKNGVRLAFFVYDLLPSQNPQWFTEKTQKSFVEWLKFITNRSDLLICISQTVAEELRSWISASRDHSPKITCINLRNSLRGASASVGLPDDAGEHIAWAKQGDCILMVGTIEPRKGHDKALAALEVLWNKPLLNENFKLLVVGRPGWKTGSLQKLLRQHPENKRRLRWIDDASDEYLDKLYQASWGVLMPSRGEGFGLPIIEAATYAKPILARDLPVFREISPPNVEFFSSDKAEDLAIAIRSWRRKSRRTDAISKEVEASAVAAELLDLIHQHLILEDGSLNHKR